MEHEVFGTGLSIVIWQEYKSCVVMSAELMTFFSVSRFAFTGQG